MLITRLNQERKKKEVQIRNEWTINWPKSFPYLNSIDCSCIRGCFVFVWTKTITLLFHLNCSIFECTYSVIDWFIIKLRMFHICRHSGGLLWRVCVCMLGVCVQSHFTVLPEFLSSRQMPTQLFVQCPRRAHRLVTFVNWIRDAQRRLLHCSRCH